jgi:uncharacterized membrane protein
MLKIIVKDKLILYSLILGFLGFVVATYLTILHYKNVLPPCSLTSNCEKVLTSQFATIGPIPLSLLGSLFYLTIIFLCILILTKYKKVFLKSFYLCVISGFIVSLILVGIQAFILHAFCQYCLTSEAISTGLLILAYLYFKAGKKGVES